jgi:glycine/sarcosine N-methyltransferase
VRTVLDMACGTGHHAALFADWGLEVVACDPSEPMLRSARERFGEAGVTWVQAGMGEIASQVGRRFDAITCLGNSYPHLLTAEEGQTALDDFARSLQGPGVLALQTLNYAQMIADGERFAGPGVLGEGPTERLFLRMWDLDPQRVTFHLLRLARTAQGWNLQVASTPQRPTFRAELERQMQAAGFREITFFGDFQGHPYADLTSTQLLAVAAL